MGIFPVTLAGNALIVILGIFVLFKARMWQKLPKDHPAIHHS